MESHDHIMFEGQILILKSGQDDDKILHFLGNILHVMAIHRYLKENESVERHYHLILVGQILIPNSGEGNRKEFYFYSK